MAKKIILLKEVFDGCNFFSGNIIDKFEYWIEKHDDKLTTYIITFGGDNKKDVSDIVDIDMNTNAHDLPKIILNAIITHYVFDNNLVTKAPRITPAYKLDNYALIKHINELIPWYVDETGDEDFSKLDAKVYEYIDDRLTELETAEFPYKTYKKWDNIDKLNELAMLIEKCAKENKK